MREIVLFGYTLKMQGMLMECLRSSTGRVVVGVFVVKNIVRERTVNV